MEQKFALKLSVIALAAALGAPLATAADDASRAAERAERATERAGDRAEKATERAGDRIERATERTGERAKSAADRVDREADVKRVAFPDMRASELIGKNVENAQGENLGEIKDLVLDVNGQKVQYAILSFGGFLGVGDKQFAYPLHTFRPSKDGDKLVLNVDKERMKQAPGFDKSEHPDFNKADYRSKVDRYFSRDGKAAKADARRSMRLASDLIGKDVVDRKGENAGEINDLVVNMSSGRVKYAVMDFDQAWTPDDKLHALPLRSMSPSKDGDKLVLAMDKSRLDRLYGFEKDNWPDVGDRSVGQRVERSFAGLNARGERSSGDSGSRAESGRNG